jgi:Na+-driven multidrug efflux pump
MAISQCAGAIYLGWVVTRPNASLRLRWQSTWQSALAAPILKIGGISSVSSLQTVATIVIVTHWVARLGTEALAGYGIGSRLEFLLVPFTFAIGVSCLPMIGMALGAGRVQQARRVAWMGAAVSAVWVGGLGLLVVIWPDAWSHWFTDQPQVLAIAADYFTRVAPFYGWFALGLCLYFASQGAGRMWGPVLAGTLRLVMVAVGGWWLSTQANAQVNDLFWLIGLAMLAYGLFAAISVKRTPWR